MGQEEEWTYTHNGPPETNPAISPHPLVHESNAVLGRIRLILESAASCFASSCGIALKDSVCKTRLRFTVLCRCCCQQGLPSIIEEVEDLLDLGEFWHEAKVTEEITVAVWAKLQPKLPYCCNNELIGIESRVLEVTSLLKIGFCDVRLIGIWGMPGIGKTTLARIVYDRIFHQFDLSCFLADMKESSEAKGLVALQRKLLSKLKIQGMEVDDTYDGKNIIRNLLCNKKVLVVLDDISEINQLEDLCIRQGWLGPGSRAIVTTKNICVYG
ncbi:TMV resistance protein N-like [Neltuma alba]|uniref:TMV resistance protein N-like n=1 Tax=Neltuma alba TaxID=207710 RepID=UPI0010A37D12|nr:TMV resistance protein N-like [Prosopis alba]